MNFAEARKAAEAAGLISDKSEYYKFKEGDNRFRLVSECLPHRGTFKGESNFKWLCYVLDRRDGKVKAHFMPHTIYKQLEALQSNPDYAFESVPMPYDVTVTAKGAGTKEVEYSLIPARKETPLTVAEYDAIAEQKPLKDLQTALLEKQQKQTAAPAVTGHLDEEPPF
jgi:hypothetical protein